MKAITICQPYAHLIALPDDDEQAKRVENRTWPTNVRGDILIHAGKSMKYLKLDDDVHDEYGIPLDKMAFGAFVAIAKLADCVQLIQFQSGIKMVPNYSCERWPWLANHQHTEGPYCFVLQNVRRLQIPISFRGAQGFFEVPKEIEQRAFEQVKVHA